MTQPLVVGPSVDPNSGRDLARLRVPFGNRHIDGATAWEMIELYNAATRDVAREAGLALIDLAAAMPKRLDHYLDLMHFSDCGSLAVAELVAKALCTIIEDRKATRPDTPCARP